MKDYIKPFIKKYIELSDSYNSIINIFKNPELKLSYIHRNIPKYVKDVEEVVAKIEEFTAELSKYYMNKEIN